MIGMDWWIHPEILQEKYRINTSGSRTNCPAITAKYGRYTMNEGSPV
jgi:hypothetical protein